MNNTQSKTFAKSLAKNSCKTNLAKPIAKSFAEDSINDFVEEYTTNSESKRVLSKIQKYQKGKLLWSIEPIALNIDIDSDFAENETLDEDFAIYLQYEFLAWKNDKNELVSEPKTYYSKQYTRLESKNGITIFKTLDGQYINGKIELYEKDEKISEWEVKNGLYFGVARDYDNGVLEREVRFVNGLYEGISVIFSQQSEIMFLSKYKQDKLIWEIDYTGKNSTNTQLSVYLDEDTYPSGTIINKDFISTLEMEYYEIKKGSQSKIKSFCGNIFKTITCIILKLLKIKT